MAAGDRKRSLEATKDMIVSSAVLEDLFGATDGWIRQLTDQGIVKRERHGKYMLIESTKNYITFLKVNNRKKKAVVDDGEVLILDAERAKHERLKREITELKLLLMKGQLHKSEDVEYVMTDMIARFRDRVMGMPSKLALKLEGKNRVDIQDVLTEELQAALNELGEYSPSDFYSDEHIDVDIRLNELADGEG